VGKKALIAAVAGAMLLGSGVLATTQRHPFWDQTTQTWVDARDPAAWRVNLCLGRTDLPRLLPRFNNFTGAHNMYNLTVDDTHTYYVLAGTTPVLVHNAGSGVCPVHPGSTATVDFYEAPSGCTCPRSIRIGPDNKVVKPEAADTERNTTSSVAEDISEQRRQAEAAGKAMNAAHSAATGSDPAGAVVVGAAATVSWGKAALARARKWLEDRRA